MAVVFGFIAVDELNSDHDPVTVLATATTKAALLASPSYDPATTSLWARNAITGQDPPIQITDQDTGDAQGACACTLQAA